MLFILEIALGVVLGLFAWHALTTDNYLLLRWVGFFVIIGIIICAALSIFLFAVYLKTLIPLFALAALIVGWVLYNDIRNRKGREPDLKDMSTLQILKTDFANVSREAKWRKLDEMTAAGKAFDHFAVEMTEQQKAHYFKWAGDPQLGRVAFRCRTAECQNIPTFKVGYRYLAGPRSRVFSAERPMCEMHADAFAKKYGIETVPSEKAH